MSILHPATHAHPLLEAIKAQDRTKRVEGPSKAPYTGGMTEDFRGRRQGGSNTDI